ncbi:MAG: hypothetical protein O9305_11760 [Rhodobacteraceae bacterium]|jgi:hypothetical protein|nr:hypothetical protein [Paracoccaceae bacterium]
MPKHVIGFIAAIAFLATPAWAASTAVGVVERGLDAYLKEGASAAVRGWLIGSALEGNPQALTQANSLRQVEDFYGKLESFAILGEHAISDRSRMVYFALNFAKGPAYGRMQVYRLGSGQWVSTEFKFHTEAAQVLPAHIALGVK